MKTSHDIIIVGGGMVGLALAVALAQRTSLSILVLEAQPASETWSEATYHPRVSAITLASQRILHSLKVWDGIAEKRVSPFNQIQVWDAAASGEINFDSSEIGESLLGYIIENSVIQTTLREKLNQYPLVELVSPIKLNALNEYENHIELIGEDDRTFTAKLAIAADGAQSWLREQAKIETTRRDYDQEAIVATVRSEFPHQKIARQVFLQSGPLAFLPLLPPTTSSIVWSLTKDEAKRVFSLDDEKFKDVLNYAFSNRLGNILEFSKRYIFPLSKHETKQYVKSRIVLIGDAAHMIHPLAGQGVNLGLLDMAALTEVMVGAIKKRRDFSSVTTLRKYERWRKADNLAMLSSVDIIKTLFASDRKTVQHLRSAGLNAVNRSQWLKKIFIQHAVGDREGLPEMAVAHH